MADETILYDLPSKDGPKCWSFNPMKTRLLLNYKQIPYSTQWVEYPDIAPTFKAFGIPPNAEDKDYTIPAIRLEGAYIMDSQAIAEVIEKAHPVPSVHLDSPYLPRAREALSGVFPALLPVWLPLVPVNLLNPPSAEYFERTRAEAVGMPLARFRESEKGGEAAWKAAGPAIDQLAALLKENKEGPFFMGHTVSYADFVLAAVLKFFQRIDSSIFERVVAHDQVLKDLFAACQPWLQKDT